jgi:hypothetical protein
MRLIKSFSWLLLCGALAFVATAAHAQPSTRVAGKIVAARVVGTVTATDRASGVAQTLANGAELSQNHQITTGAGSSVVLVFSNGASLNLGAESTLAIEEFLQDPFTTPVSPADMTEEPTTSTTKLNLTRGELVGNVKHLKHEEGSTFEVQTPVGAAGIRGTTFRIVFRPDASGRVFFTLSTADGTVLFEAPAAEGVNVETGNEVVVTVDVTVDAENATVTMNSTPEVGSVLPMSPATEALIAVQAQQIIADSATVILTTTTSEMTTPAGGLPPSNEGDGGENEQTQEAQDDPAFTPSNDTTVPIPGPIKNTTPGDGKTI